MRRVVVQSFVLLASLALLIGVFATSSANTASADEKKSKPCIAKKFKYAKVKAACDAGGQKAVKALMKSIVKKAKKAGDENASNCLNCHEDFKTFKRTKNAEAWLKPYIK